MSSTTWTTSTTTATTARRGQGSAGAESPTQLQTQRRVDRLGVAAINLFSVRYDRLLHILRLSGRLVVISGSWFEIYAHGF